MIAQLLVLDPEVKSSAPELLPKTQPDGSWNLDALGLFAQSQHQDIVAGEKVLAVAYWQLGLALNLARQSVTHGQWKDFLQRLGIKKTRDARARAIHAAFATVDEVSELSVDQAYSRRILKKPKGRRRKNRKLKLFEAPLSKFLKNVRSQARHMVDIAETTEPQLANKLLPVVSEALSRLTALKQRLERQAQSSESQLRSPVASS